MIKKEIAVFVNALSFGNGKWKRGEEMRINKTQYFLNIATEVARRSTCLRVKFGAILVSSDGIILATGYNGPARGSINCEDVGWCLKDKLKAKTGNYDDCNAVHAEENCIANAARSGVSIKGAILYYSAVQQLGKIYRIEHGRQISEIRDRINHWFLYGSCARCRRLLINAGISKVVSPKKDWLLKDLIQLDRTWFYNKGKGATI